MFIIYHYWLVVITQFYCILYCNSPLCTVLCTIFHHFELYYLYCTVLLYLYFNSSLWSMELVSTCHFTEGVYISNSTANQSLTTVWQSITHHRVFRLPGRLLAVLHFRYFGSWYALHTVGVRISLAIGSTRLIYWSWSTSPSTQAGPLRSHFIFFPCRSESSNISLLVFHLILKQSWHWVGGMWQSKWTDKEDQRPELHSPGPRARFIHVK